MTKSHKHQQVGLYTALVERARKGLPGISIGTIELMFNFDSQEQVQHALDALVESGHITIDIGGRFPSLRLLKDRYKALHNRGRALILSSGAPRAAADQKPAAVDKRPAEQTPVQAVAPEAVEPVQMPPFRFQEPAKQETAAVVAAASPPPPAPPAPIVEPVSPVEACLHLEDAKGPPPARQVAFRIADHDLTWIMQHLDSTNDSITFQGFCRQLFQAELDRRQSPEGSKHKLTADVIRAAREEGRDLGEFVTSIIAVGMKAREMNRRGI